MSDVFTLHGSPHSQFTYKVALMLNLARQPFCFRYVSFQKGVHLTPEFRELSRWGQVPVLQHGNHTLVQSGAILEYLAATLGKFGSHDREMHQRIREWLYWNTDRLAPPIYGCYGIKLGQLKLLPTVFDPAIVEYHRRRAEEALSVLDGNLVGDDFLVSGQPTIADICCYGEVAFAQLCDFELSRWPNIGRWAGRIATLPGFKAPFDLLAMADAQIPA
jgi:glutathione S-transferase